MRESPDKKPRSLLARIARTFLAIFAALWMFFEEWVWDSLTAAMAWLARLPPLRWAEARISRLPPGAAMAAFVLPWLLLVPAKVLALWLIATHHFKWALTVFVIGKVLGTALLARLFALTRPALLTIGWFRRLYTWFTAWRSRLYAYVRSLRAWQAARAWIVQLRKRVRAWWRTLRRMRDA